jgi:hypothetical protein
MSIHPPRQAGIAELLGIPAIPRTSDVLMPLFVGRRNHELERLDVEL